MSAAASSTTSSSALPRRDANPYPLRTPAFGDRDTSPTSLETSGRPGSITIADKSCAQCRSRKVRCNKEAPSCSRCTKRNERCCYPADSVFQDAAQPIPGSEEKAKIAELEYQLRTLQARFASTNDRARCHYISSISSQASSSYTPAQKLSDLPSRIYASFTSALALNGDAAGGPQHVLDAFLSAKRFPPPFVMQELLQRELVASLVEAASASSSVNLPSFSSLRALVEGLDLRSSTNSFGDLPPSIQVAIVVLCSLGARHTPDAELLGTRQSSSTSAGRLLSLGERRERACQSLLDLAFELCWTLRVVIVNAVGHVEMGDGARVERLAARRALLALLGVCQLAIEEGGPLTKARWILRNATGIYEDLQIPSGASGLPHDDVQLVFGPLFYDLDAAISARLLTPPLLDVAHLPEIFYFPNSPATTLVNLVNEFGKLPSISESRVQQVVIAASLATSSCQRQFGVVGSTLSSLPSTISAIRELWATLDRTHTAVQQIQHFFVRVPVLDSQSLDRYILDAVRIDMGLLALCSLVHAFLGRLEAGTGPELGLARRESELRIRKCLKLFGFYSQIFASSMDKSHVYQLVQQLEFSPNWTTVVCQRVGDVGGPPSPEFEISKSELEGLTAALETACVYSPVAARRLAELAAHQGLPSPFPITKNAELAPVLTTHSHAQCESAYPSPISATSSFYGSPSSPALFKSEEAYDTYLDESSPESPGSPVFTLPSQLLAGAFTGRDGMGLPLMGTWDIVSADLVADSFTDALDVGKLGMGGGEGRREGDFEEWCF